MIPDGSLAMAKEWTDEEVSAEIAKAVGIVREDRFEKFVRGKLGTPAPGNGPPAPPAKDEPTGDLKPPRKGLWWGDALNDPEPPKPPADPPGGASA